MGLTVAIRLESRLADPELAWKAGRLLASSFTVGISSLSKAALMWFSSAMEVMDWPSKFLVGERCF